MSTPWTRESNPGPFSLCANALPLSHPYGPATRPVPSDALSTIRPRRRGYIRLISRSTSTGSREREGEGGRTKETRNVREMNRKEESASLLLGPFPKIHPRGGRVVNHLGKNILNTRGQDSTLDLPVIGGLIYCEGSALDHVATGTS
uniref:Uncharacterized protein n=1 Tax=Timema monikensis TaxID=170555 RepID=A0A7R9HN59_9NEOP|nr:unnamed protein product [Timema monikensis]